MYQLLEPHFFPTLHLKWSNPMKQETHFDYILQTTSKSYNYCNRTARWEMGNNHMQLRFLSRISFSKSSSETNSFKVMLCFIYSFLMIKKMTYVLKKLLLRGTSIKSRILLSFWKVLLTQKDHSSFFSFTMTHTYQIKTEKTALQMQQESIK